MNIHEHQAKAVLAEFGVAVPKGFAAFTVDEAAEAAKKLGGPVFVVKSQIHAGSHIMCAPNNAHDGAISVRTSSHRCRRRPQRPPANVPHYSAQGRDGIRGAGGRDVGE